jgi:hypothetical protein
LPEKGKRLPLGQVERSHLPEKGKEAAVRSKGKVESLLLKSVIASPAALDRTR